MVDKATGFARSVVHGATLGQEPYLVGILNESLNLPKKVYEAKSINDIYKLYKGTGKDTIRVKNDYTKAYDEFKKEHPYLSYGGEVLGASVPMGAVVKGIRLGVDTYRLGKEKDLLGKAYDEVKNYPLKGTRTGKDDIMVEIRPIGDKNKYVINRGAAIEKDGKIIFQDKPPLTDLYDNTGTKDNFGLAKAIYHEVPKEEVVKIPKYIRKYEPNIDKIAERETWVIPLDKKHDFRIGFGKEGSKQKLLTTLRTKKGNRNTHPLSKKRN